MLLFIYLSGCGWGRGSSSHCWFKLCSENTSWQKKKDSSLWGYCLTRATIGQHKSRGLHIITAETWVRPWIKSCWLSVLNWQDKIWLQFKNSDTKPLMPLKRRYQANDGFAPGIIWAQVTNEQASNTCHPDTAEKRRYAQIMTNLNLIYIYHPTQFMALNYTSLMYIDFGQILEKSKKKCFRCWRKNYNF